MRNTEGAAQTIIFPKIADVPASTKEMKLTATSDAGLPVQYYVHFGPAEIDGGTLKLLPIPPRAKYPVKVEIVRFSGAGETARRCNPPGR